jgi:hypothetical protein
MLATLLQGTLVEICIRSGVGKDCTAAFIVGDTERSDPDR